MKITPIRTHKITSKDSDIFKILDQYVHTLSEKSIVAVTSKIISICEGRIVPIRKVSKVSKVSGVSKGEEKDQKDELIEQESEFFLPRNLNPYNVSLTIAHGMLAASAGVDESNGNGYYILWPQNPQESANAIRLNLKHRFNLDNVGVIITDSKTTPLRWGVTGVSIAHSGFLGVRSYVGEKDLFGREFLYEKVNVADSLAAGAVFAMGEGDESTPLAVISELSSVAFQDKNPTAEELKELFISHKEDLYSPLLTSVDWKKGHKKF